MIAATSFSEPLVDTADHSFVSGLAIRSGSTSGKRSASLRTEALNLLGGCCVRCGETDFRVLQINHIQGDGLHHHAARGYNSGTNLVRKIIKGLVDHTTLEILCANCHQIVTYETQYGSQ